MANAKFTAAEITAVMEKRGVSRKSAEQWLRRQSKKDAAPAVAASKPQTEKPQARTMAAPTHMQANPLPPSLMVTALPAAKPAPVVKAAPAPKPAPPVKADAPVPPSTPTHQFILSELSDGPKGLYACTVHGRKALVLYIERNRSDAALRFNSLTMGTARVDAAQTYAKKAGLPLYYAAQVRVNDKWNGGWLIAEQTAQVFVVASSDYRLSPAARIAYAACKSSYGDGGARFEIHEQEAK